MITAAVAAVAGTGYSMYSGERQRKLQKAEARKQQKAIDEEKAQALETRKQMIDQQRMQMSGTGQGTRGTSTSGVKANIGGNTLG